MNDEDVSGEGMGEPADNELRPAGPPDFSEAVDFDWLDYLLLPDYGIGYYNLPDAALMGAIDAGFSGRIPGVFPEHWGSEESEEAEFRRGIAPTQKDILELLTRCVGTGLLKAEVKARNPTDSSPVPERTYVSLGDLVECLEMHGMPQGDFFDREFEAASDATQAEAQAVARARAQLRHGTSDIFATVGPPPMLPGEQPEDFWKRTAETQRLKIAELRSRGDGRRPHPAARELSTKERNTLLTIIAVLCKQADLDPAKTAKTAGVLQGTAARMGIQLGETTIENKLKAIPEAVASRMR